MKRASIMYSHTFSAAVRMRQTMWAATLTSCFQIVVGAIATKTPQCSLATAALHELGTREMSLRKYLTPSQILRAPSSNQEEITFAFLASWQVLTLKITAVMLNLVTVHGYQTAGEGESKYPFEGCHCKGYRTDGRSSWYSRSSGCLY